MTGYQVTGPDRDAWEQIDPDGAARRCGTAARATC